MRRVPILCGRKFLAMAAATAMHSPPPPPVAGAAVDFSAPWVDDTAAEAAALHRHHFTPAYKELHRPAMTQRELGGFGGEAGFDVAPRQYVDPDRSHLPYIFNTFPLTGNLRSARYGFFKDQFSIIDVDKLLRWARRIPSAEKVFSDFIAAKVPLSDKDCAAIVRHAHKCLECFGEEERRTSYWTAEELFERMLITAFPPCECGPRTHAAMIRLCIPCKRWKEGWEWYRKRAYEEASAQPSKFVLDSGFHDACIELCVALDHPEEALDEFETLVKKNIRVRRSTLTAMLQLCANNKLHDEGEDVWKLFEYYQHDKTADDYMHRLHWCAITCGGGPSAMFTAIAEADRHNVSLPLRCFSWVIYGMRHSAKYSRYVAEIIGECSRRGLGADYELFTMCFEFCATHGCGMTAMAINDQLLAADVNYTAEMVLLMTQAFAKTPASEADVHRPRMIQIAWSAFDKMRRKARLYDFESDIYTAFLALCATAGASSYAFSAVKHIVTGGGSMTVPQLNSLLLCNARAAPPNGSVRSTEEILTLFQMVLVGGDGATASGGATVQTILHLRECLKAHGSSPEVEALITSIGIGAGIESWREDGAPLPESKLPHDPPLREFDCSPLELHALRTKWKINVRDMGYRRLGEKRFHRTDPTDRDRAVLQRKGWFQSGKMEIYKDWESK